jgi:predicted RNA-binding Zn-ribbon protein involved in translation (DUF1610 family)
MSKCMSFDKYDCLKRAKDLLSRDDDSLLRYSCLELRFCLEAITYEKLRLYATRLPAEVLEKWQPPQALRALLEYEPYADQNFTLRIATEVAPGVPSDNWITLGTHKAFKVTWLRKTYNKLGSFLHIPSVKTANNLSPSNISAQLRKDIENIIAELEPIVASPIDSSLASVITFQCSVCEDYVLINKDALQKRKCATCLNPNCSAEFFAEEDDSCNFQFQLIATAFDCQSCGHSNLIENRKLKIGFRFKCDSCGEEYEFIQRQWGYGKTKDLYNEKSS